MTVIRRFLSVLAASSLVVGVAMAQQTPTPQPDMPTPDAKPTPSMPDVPVPPPPEFNARAWVLMDYDSGRLLVSHNPDQRETPASLTKLVNAYVVGSALKAGKVKWDQPVFVSTHAWKKGGGGTDGSTSFLKVHSKVPLDDLLKGMLVQSGNDAAIALAEAVGGSEQGFASLMNAYAQRIGMTGSHFTDASGYPSPDHYSTAHDIARVTRALIRDFPRIYAIAKLKSFTWNGIKQGNRNLLLWRDPTVDGAKTGHTADAGYCLDASAKRDGMRLIAVVMGSPSEQARASDAEALLNYGFSFFTHHTLYKAGKPLATPRLWKGQDNKLPIGVTDDVQVTIKRGDYKNLKATVDIPGTLVAPYKKGQKVGTLHVTLDGKPLLDRPLVALSDAPQGGFFKRLWDAIVLWFHHLGGSKH
ncbi:D-alanyl-D-alanine carboxypeptidase family protein [Oleiagrimonas sp. C23AA]|uniref:D-alanyl-D-alanine carboxypeptidase family protein n=1 Tax=Oleiagrimonas sp. C23AA TaxID=2719047 RepID=UPI001423B764|nr:D-alanyl-D-alanine carboxypeptidase family protein [Oleiagrimonas sp. C23AA]NII09661.1 D-alanyl-D-alanine carboxypeptidase [Oleiagrimonas sp. C23AA]